MKCSSCTGSEVLPQPSLHKSPVLLYSCCSSLATSKSGTKLKGVDANMAIADKVTKLKLMNGAPHSLICILRPVAPTRVPQQHASQYYTSSQDTATQFCYTHACIWYNLTVHKLSMHNALINTCLQKQYTSCICTYMDQCTYNNLWSSA